MPLFLEIVVWVFSVFFAVFVILLFFENHVDFGRSITVVSVFFGICLLLVLVMLIGYRFDSATTIIGYIVFSIFTLLFPIFIGRGIWQIINNKKEDGIFRIIIGMVFISLSIVILIFWLTPVDSELRIVGWVLFSQFSLLFFALVIRGILKFHANKKKVGILHIIIGAMFAGLSWAILNYWLDTAAVVLGWLVSFAFIVITCPTLIVWGIYHVYNGKKMGVIKIASGMASAGLGWTAIYYWFLKEYPVFLIFGWVEFIIFGVLCLFFLGWGLHDISWASVIHIDGYRSGIIKIMGGLFCAALSMTLLFLFLDFSDPVFYIIGLVLFWGFGVFGALTTIFSLYGLLLKIREKSDDNPWCKYFITGAVGLGVAWVIGNYWITVPWLHTEYTDSFWSPFVVIPVITIITGVLLGLMLNLGEYAAYRSGGKIELTHEWRYVNSGAKYGDATVRDVYDHIHGSGSWVKQLKHSFVFFRVLSIFVSAFGFIGLLLYSNIKDQIIVFQITMSEYSEFSALAAFILFAILLLISVIIGLIFIASKKSYY